MHELEIRDQIAASGRFPIAKNEDLEFLVLGTVELKAWKKSLENPKPIGKSFEHMADIKSCFEVNYEPGGWHFDEGPQQMIVKNCVVRPGAATQ